MRKFLVIIAFCFFSWSTLAQDFVPCIDAMGGEYDEASQSCIEHGTLEIDIQYPAWILDYRFIIEIVQPHISAVRAGYVNSGLNFFSERSLFFEIKYREHWHSDHIVTVVFYTIADYGGLYPISSVKTFTFDLASNKHLTFADLFVEDSDPLEITAPRTSEEACFSCFLSSENAEEDIANYENFILTESELIFIFPPVRMGAMNAGIIEVVFSLDNLEDILAIPKN